MKYSTELSACEPSMLVERLVSSAVFDSIGMKRLPEAARRDAEEGFVEWRYASGRGSIVAQNDGIRIVIEAFAGKRKALRCAIRDRRLDATTEVSPLTSFPNSDPACNRLPKQGFLAAELSIYSWDPRTLLRGVSKPGSLANFIADPDRLIWASMFEARKVFKLWERAFKCGRAPWQQALPIKGAAIRFVRESELLLSELGYNRADCVPSWLNVAGFFERLGYAFSFGEHECAYRAIKQALAQRFPQASPAQQSWLAALQNIPELSLPRWLRLPGRWAVSHTNMYWIRMHKELTLCPEPSETRAFSARLRPLFS